MHGPKCHKDITLVQAIGCIALKQSTCRKELYMGRKHQNNEPKNKKQTPITKQKTTELGCFANLQNSGCFKTCACMRAIVGVFPACPIRNWVREVCQPAGCCILSGGVTLLTEPHQRHNSLSASRLFQPVWRCHTTDRTPPEAQQSVSQQVVAACLEVSHY